MADQHAHLAFAVRAVHLFLVEAEAGRLGPEDTAKAARFRQAIVDLDRTVRDG